MNMTTTSPKAKYNLLYVYFICLVAALGGLMFGFDLGIITGIVPYIEHQFNLSGFGLGLVVAIFELGAMTGALATGRIADKFGRKKTLISAALLFAITAVGVSFANGAILIGTWRFAQGICVGAASVLSPMYIAEVAPARVRGRLVSYNQLTIILGILLASYCNFYFGDNDLNSANWRYMFLSALVPSVAFLVLLFFIPESPRWLILQSHKDDEADRIFVKINKGNEVQAREEIADIRNSVANDDSRSRVSLKTVFGRAFLPIVLIGFGIAFLQQFCGINNVTPYMQKIFVMAGIELKEGLLNAVFVQLVFFFSTFIAIGLIDKIGRKILMLTGTGLMAVTLFLLALAFNAEAKSGVYILVLVMVYTGAFAFTLGPVVWVLISEMYPNEIRGRAIGLTSAALWLATFLVVLVSPYLLNIGPVFNFVIFGALNVAGFLFCLKYLPETKKKTLEQMKEVWQKRGYLKAE
jgi:SP family arabinose:H+ symporter-like MFS transporter